ncbi:MAG: hypothetical protein H6719_20290 [Sandaracinaceae bacterium]|nr:hypothetical protein [Sandaracinaceae bacterium]
MPNRTTPLALAASLCLAACATRAPLPTTPAAEPTAWRTHAPPGAGISFEMPGDPEVVTQSTFSPQGSAVAVTGVFLNEGPRAFGVGVAEVEGGVAGDALAFANLLRESMTRDTARRVTAPPRRIDVPGFHALAYVGLARSSTLLTHVVIGRRRVYVASAIVTDSASLEGAERFLASIRLDPADALVPTIARGESGALDWVYVEPERFALRMPPAHRDLIRDANLVGRPAVRHQVDADCDGAAYHLDVYTFAGDPPPLGEAIDALHLEGDPAPLTTSGFAGAELCDPSGTCARVHRTDHRLVVARITPAPGADPTTTREYLDSLRLFR